MTNKEYKDVSTLIYLYKLAYGEPESCKEEFNEERYTNYCEAFDHCSLTIQNFKKLYEKKLELEKAPNTVVEVYATEDEDLYLWYSGLEPDEVYDGRKEDYKERMDRIEQNVKEAKEIFKDPQLLNLIKSYYENMLKLKKRQDDFFFKMEENREKEKEELNHLEAEIKKLKEKKELHNQILNELNLNI